MALTFWWLRFESVLLLLLWCYLVVVQIRYCFVLCVESCPYDFATLKLKALTAVLLAKTFISYGYDVLVYYVNIQTRLNRPCWLWSTSFRNDCKSDFLIWAISSRASAFALSTIVRIFRWSGFNFELICSCVGYVVSVAFSVRFRLGTISVCNEPSLSSKCAVLCFKWVSAW